MSNTKTILVACGKGIATSQAVAIKIKDRCDKEGIPVEVIVSSIEQVSDHIDRADAYVTIGPKTSLSRDIPIISGIPFLTGLGLDEEFAKLRDALLNK